mgnify:CR=1 FL=1
MRPDSSGTSATTKALTIMLGCAVTAMLAVTAANASIANPVTDHALLPVSASLTGRTLPTTWAWPIVTDAQKVNVAYPDTDAIYWMMPHKVEPGIRPVVNGTFPSARFLSFTPPKYYLAEGPTARFKRILS